MPDSSNQIGDWPTIVETAVCLMLIVAIVIEHRRVSLLNERGATAIAGCAWLNVGRAKAVYARTERYNKGPQTEVRRVIR